MASRANEVERMLCTFEVRRAGLCDRTFPRTLTTTSVCFLRIANPIPPLPASLPDSLAQRNATKAKLNDDEDDDMKYSMSTPKRSWNCLLRVWQAGGVSDERIIQDINRWKEAIPRIIANQGCALLDVHRNGHRKEAHRQENSSRRVRRLQENRPAKGLDLAKFSAYTLKNADSFQNLPILQHD
eukprot:scaffold492_cov257-Pinguiococcus_pyrenoidosus.AAC.52